MLLGWFTCRCRKRTCKVQPDGVQEPACWDLSSWARTGVLRFCGSRSSCRVHVWFGSTHRCPREQCTGTRTEHGPVLTWRTPVRAAPAHLPISMLVGCNGVSQTVRGPGQHRPRTGDAPTKGGTTTDQWPPKQGATMCVRHLAHSASAEVCLGPWRLRCSFRNSGSPARSERRFRDDHLNT